MNRRRFLTSAAAFATLASVRQLRARTTTTAPATTRSTDLPGDVVWHDVRDWGVEGKAFADTDGYFDRLPARAKGVVREAVWSLSRHSTGMSVRFETDRPQVYVRYTLTSDKLAMPHMPATGVSGLDTYVRHEGRWRYLSTTSPSERTVTGTISRPVASGPRQYLVHLPLYNGVKSMEIGVPKDATFTPTPPRKDRPILFYGTSVTQGACASRPGMAFTNLLGMRLDRPMLNFGFSGNGLMELEVGRFLSEIDAALFVLDCTTNSTPEQIRERCVPLVKMLRDAHPSMPILLLDHRWYANSAVVPTIAAGHARKRELFRKQYEDLVAGGVSGIHYRDGEDLIGSDGEGTTDASHPNDLGMMRYADALEPDLRKILEM